MKNYIKEQFKRENLFYTIMFMSCLLVLIISRSFMGFSSILWIADIGTICGILNVINTAKHNVWGLIFNFISSSFIVATSIIQHIWLTAVITAFISLPMLFMGIINWRKHERNNEYEKNLNTMNTQTLLIIIASLIILDILFTFILYYLNSNLFYLDSLVSSCCLLGIILSSKMYLEQFYFFIAGNFFGIIMYSILFFQNPNNISYVFLFLFELIVVIMGLINWKRLNRQKLQEKQPEQVL